MFSARPEYSARPATTTSGRRAGLPPPPTAPEGGPNQFSRPERSFEKPLRSLLLDPDTNNIPRSQTQSGLRASMRRMNMPHISYDIDGDGIVSQEDYFLAKRFDLDGNGVLDADEREVGRFIMAQDFFRQHREDIHLYGDEWKNEEADNVERLATSHTFQKQLNKLKETEKHFRDVGSLGATKCLNLANKDLIKHNFYQNKFDTSAWNDHGADPRPSNFSKMTHGGSREKMHHLRTIRSRETSQRILNSSYNRLPASQLNKCRTSPLTSVSDGHFAYAPFLGPLG